MIPINIEGKRFGKLVAISLVPERKSGRKTREWLFQCDCGNKIVIEQRAVNGKARIQQSCGCIREKAHLVATTKIPIEFEYVDKFDDFKKYAFLHKAFVHCNPTNQDIIFYKQFIEKFYIDKQFNLIYLYWIKENKINSNNTFYNWYKPSVDHIVPKSKGGTQEINNYQFLTLFENLGKRDMTMDEWVVFLQETNTKSDLFIDSIIKKEEEELDIATG